MGGSLELQTTAPEGARFLLGLRIELPAGSHHHGDEEPEPAPAVQPQA
jgi:hypothetical protein